VADDRSTEVDPATRELVTAIEAVLMAATEPVPPAELAQLLEIATTRVEELCRDLADEYARDGRGFVLARVAGGYRYQTHPDQAPYVERFVLEGQSARLSGPALETLAIVAYKQPISRAQLSAIRGVNVEATLRTLVQRGYIEETGHEPTLGSPALFGTTTTFLDKLGIDSLADLPPLADFMPEAHVVEALERGLQLREPSATEVLDDAGGDGPGDGVDDHEFRDEDRDEDRDESNHEGNDAAHDRGGEAVAAELAAGVEMDDSTGA
jgi:segregation and condensation protein B